MKKITTILLLSVLVAIITVVSLMALFVPVEIPCSVGEDCGHGGSGSADPNLSCDPDDVGKTCCKIVKSKDQCNNRCDSKAQTCNWSTAETTICKTRVTQDCTLV